jgi:peptide deformylase
MTVRPIRMYGDPVLRQKAPEVIDLENNAEVPRLVTDLADTLVDAGGAGLAAPQIGVSQRVFVYRWDDEVHHLVNPEFVATPDEDEDEVVDVEGCLSIPGLAYDLARPRRIVAKGFDQHGEPLVVDGTERLARCLAHETDHLDGVLFIDRLPPDLRKRALREIRELLLAGEDVRIAQSPHARFLG